MMGLLVFSSYAGLRKRAKKFRSGKIAVRLLLVCEKVGTEKELIFVVGNRDKA